MTPEIYADKIFYYKNAIKDPLNIVDLLEKSNDLLTDSDALTTWHNWESSGEGDMYAFGHRKLTNKYKLSTSSSDVRQIYDSLYSSLELVGMDYANAFNFPYTEPNSISVSKYNENAYMGAHVDYYGDPEITPLMSAVAYLNDNYEGGELSFPEQNVSIKPEAGSIVVFPSIEPFYHQSMPTQKGTKYVSPAFWVKANG